MHKTSKPMKQKILEHFWCIPKISHNYNKQMYSTHTEIKEATATKQKMQTISS